MKVSYAIATKAQLATFALTTLGLELGPRESVADLRAKIAAAGFTGDEIEIDEDEGGAPRDPLTMADVAERKMIMINIPESDAPDATADVAVGVNGKVVRIMRGFDVSVPIEYVEVLRNATKTSYSRGPNQELIDPRQVPAIPFSIVSA